MRFQPYTCSIEPCPRGDFSVNPPVRRLADPARKRSLTRDHAVVRKLPQLSDVALAYGVSGTAAWAVETGSGCPGDRHRWLPAYQVSAARLIHPCRTSTSSRSTFPASSSAMRLSWVNSPEWGTHQRLRVQACLPRAGSGRLEVGELPRSVPPAQGLPHPS